MMWRLGNRYSELGSAGDQIRLINNEFSFDLVG